MHAILVVNAGSSSVKFQVFETDGKSSLKRLIKGQMDGIGTRPRLRAQAADNAALIDQTYGLDVVSDVPSAIREAGAWLRTSQKLNLIAVGHRVVHGGPGYSRPVLIDEEIIKKLERYIPLAPLHQPNNLAPIRSLLKNSPELPQVACFDTAFHRDHSAVADHFAIPEHLYKEGVRRYGFHGLSYEFVARRMQELFPEVAKGRVIVAHLGSGASMCALSGGRSVESTMGFTALDGLPMGTRPGQIDPGVVLYLISEKGMSAEAVQKLFYNDCGLKGLSGISNDMRVLETGDEPGVVLYLISEKGLSAEAVQRLLYNDCGLKGLSGISNDMRVLETGDEPGAKLAIDYFVYRIGLYAGMLAAALGGLDAFVFTAGIGENSHGIRARISEKLAWLGAELDAKANAGRKPLISRPDSRVKLYVIPTDEELMIAEHTIATIAQSKTSDLIGLR